MIKLRDYQLDTIAALRQKLRDGNRSVILVAATGAGKTTMAADIVKGASMKGTDVFFLAHRKELIEQASARFDEYGLAHGIIKSGNTRVNDEPVQVASKDTLVRRLHLIKGGKQCILIIDECHRSTANTYTKIIDVCKERYDRVFLIGLTATPFRTDGRGLGDLYESFVDLAGMQALIDRGFLVPPRAFSTPDTPDMSDVMLTAGEFNAKQAARKFEVNGLVGGVVSNWLRVAKDRLTVVYSSSLRHNEMLFDAFTSAGISACVVTGNTEDEMRGALLDAFSNRRYQVVINYGVLTEGWDCPEVGCVVIARATMSAGVYIQMAGRGARSFGDKKDYILLDHGNNVLRHGLPQDHRDVSLSGIVKRPSKAASENDSLTTCAVCYAIFSSTLRSCPACGKERPVARKKPPQTVEADLKEIKQSPTSLKKGMRETYKKLVEEATKRGLPLSWARKMYYLEFGQFPKYRKIEPPKKWQKTWNPALSKWEFKLL